VRIDDYKYRSLTSPRAGGDKTHVDVPYLINLRLDPFRAPRLAKQWTKEGAQQYFDWFSSSSGAFCVRPAGDGQGLHLPRPTRQWKRRDFNLDAVKAEMAEMEQAQAAAKGTGQNANDLHGGRLARVALLLN